MAPRLSGSKVKELTDQSQRLFHEDTKLVSAYFRLNNNLPPMSQARVSSLYVFDAIARATQKAGRQGSEMLKKLEAVVGSWVSGMVDDGRGGVWVEGKVGSLSLLQGTSGRRYSCVSQDKTRKIIEIWTKSATFPPSCLDKLSTNIRSPDYEPPPPIMSPALPPEETSGTPLGGYLAGTGQGEWPVLIFCVVLGWVCLAFVTTPGLPRVEGKRCSSYDCEFRPKYRIKNNHRPKLHCKRSTLVSGLNTNGQAFDIPKLDLALVDPSTTCMHPMRLLQTKLSMLFPCSGPVNAMTKAIHVSGQAKDQGRGVVLDWSEISLYHP